MKLPVLIKAVFLAALFSAVSVAGAQELTIKRLNTSTVNISGKSLKVGDRFNRNEVVNWSDAKQALIAQDESGKMYRLSAAAVKGKPGFSFEKLVGIQKSYKHLSTRALGDDVDVSGEYIIDDEVLIPTGLDSDVEYEVEILYSVNGTVKTYKPQLNADKTMAVIKSDIFDKGDKSVLNLKMFITPIDEEEYCASDEITLIPLECAFDSE